MVYYVMSYSLKDNSSWEEHEKLANEKIYPLLKRQEGVTEVKYYYVVVGPNRWRRYWIIKMESMSVREKFYADGDLIKALQDLTFMADPSTHTDMFWEESPLD